jgi:hypothetical protein
MAMETRANQVAKYYAVARNREIQKFTGGGLMLDKRGMTKNPLRLAGQDISAVSERQVYE